MTEIEALRARLNTLEEELGEVKTRLDTEALQRRGLMRDTRRCPACGHTRIFHAEALQTMPNGNKLCCLHIEARGVFVPDLFGVVQVFVCAACGHAEMQIKDPQGLAGKKRARLLEAGDHNEGPYR